jgi:hypothetical protein
MIPGDHWPIFLYAGHQYDAEDPWKGLFRSSILILVCSFDLISMYVSNIALLIPGLQACFYISQLSGKGR